MTTMKEIQEQLINYVYDNSLTIEGDKEGIPLDVSLIECGILDSYEIIEMIAFIENRWKIEITVEDFTIEKMGSINKMSKLISYKIT